MVAKESLEALKAHQWPKGTTGNAAGRPKGIETAVRAAIAKQEFIDAAGVVHKGLDAVLARLFALFFDKGTTPRDAVAISKELFDRSFGKAKQTVKIEDDNAPIATMPRDPAEMTTEELRKAIEAIGTLKRLAVVSGGNTEH